jgi:hypothetical protein
MIWIAGTVDEILVFIMSKLIIGRDGDQTHRTLNSVSVLCDSFWRPPLLGSNAHVGHVVPWRCGHC